MKNFIGVDVDGKTGKELFSTLEELLSTIGKTFGDPWKLNDDVADFKKIFIAYMTKKDLKNWYEDFDLHLNDEDKFSDLMKKTYKDMISMCNTGIGTHTSKIPDPSFEVASYRTSKKERNKENGKNFFSGMSIDTCRRYGAAGNAAKMPIMRFLTALVEINGTQMSMVEAISENDSLKKMMKLEIPSLDHDDFDKAFSNLEHENENRDFSNERRLLFWPLSENSYMQIAPQFSYALAIALKEKIKNLKESEITVFGQTISVGGTKPQNAGVVNADMGGEQLYLHSFPPKRNIVSWGEIKRVTYRKSLFSNIQFEHQGIDNFKKIIEKKSNMNTREKQSEILDELLTTYLKNYDIIHDAILNDMSVDMDGFNSFEKALVEHDINDLPLELEIELTNKFVDYLGKSINYIFDANFKDMVRTIIRNHDSEGE